MMYKYLLQAVILVCVPAMLSAQFERGDALVSFSGSFVSDREKEPERITSDYQFSGRFFYFLNDRLALEMEAATRFAPLANNIGSAYLFDNYLSSGGRYYLLDNLPLFLQFNLLFQQRGAVQNNLFAPGEALDVWRFGLGIGIGSTLKLSKGTSLDFGAYYRYLNSEDESVIRTGYSWKFSLHTLANFRSEREKYQRPLKKRAPQQGTWLLLAQMDAFGPGSEGLLLDSDASLGFFLSDGWVLGLNISSDRQSGFSEPAVSLRNSTGEGFIRFYRPIRDNLQWFPTLSFTRGRERTFRDDELDREIMLRHFSFGAGASYFLNRYTALEFQLAYARGARNTRLPFNNTGEVSFLRFSVKLMHYLRK